MNNRRRFDDGEWAWVSGASSGIGKAVALKLASEGVGVTLSARREQELEQTAKAMRDQGGKADVAVVDFADPGAIAAAAKRIAERNGRLDIVISCAGRELLLPFPMLTPAKVESVWSVQLAGVLEMVRSSFKLLRESGARTDGGQGRVVFVSSVAAVRGYPAQVAYSACKAAQLGAMRSLAVELAPFHIRVNAVSPGMVQTPMQERMFARMPAEKRDALVAVHPLGLGKPEDVAAAIVFLASNESCWITGADLAVDGGVSIT